MGVKVMYAKLLSVNMQLGILILGPEIPYLGYNTSNIYVIAIYYNIYSQK